MPGLTVVLPLDGTELSETAYSLLPLLKAVGFDRVRLVSAWESGLDREHLRDEHKSLHDEVAEKGQSFLQSYLTTQEAVIQPIGFEVEKSVRIGKAAEEILAAAEGADLILMATHGRDGLARVRLGSVADRVVREAGCPTLVIGPNVDVELTPYTLSRILVPLDGSELAESALPIAVWIAQKLGAEVELVRAVSLIPVGYDTTMGEYPIELMTAVEDSAKTYLARIAAQIAGRVKVSSTMVLGSATEQVLDHLKEKPAGLVVMATHGRTGIARAVVGSVFDRVLHGPAPVLGFNPEDGVRSRLIEAALAG